MNARHHIRKTTLAAMFLAGLAMPAAAETSFGGFKPPSGWLPPPVNPTSVDLTTRKLAPGVYALLSTRPPVDNGGFIVGTRGVLVVDAHINATMANKIQAAVRKVTEKPILYLAIPTPMATIRSAIMPFRTPRPSSPTAKRLTR